MQDYIFNSRKQATRRRRRMLFRLLLLVLIIGIIAILANNFSGMISFSGDQKEESASDRDLLPLPPVEKTRPVGKNQVPPLSPGPTTPAEITRTTETDTQPATSPSKPAPSDTDRTLAEKEPLPAPATTETEAAPSAGETLRWVEHLIKKGDTLAAIFNDLNLAPSLLHQIINSSEMAGRLSRIRPGQQLRLAFDEKGILHRIILEQDRINSLRIERTSEGFRTTQQALPVETREAVAQGVITSSLFAAGQKAGLSDSQIMELANIFGWDIDFALEIREGDQFSVIYEEIYLNGEKLRNGPILAAEFVNRGKVYRAVRYTDSNGETAYYDADGHAKRRAFMRTPVKFSRISSGFTRKRWHPVLKKWRSHKGVDYAAPRGTPVKATGNGKVVFRGRKGGYGNVIFLRHGGRYTTVYGHLNGFARGLKTGSKVKQGQVIGYVGSTGLATGPHLHYEFRINGVHRNPLTVKLPRSMQLPKKEMARFLMQTRPMIARLDELRAKSMVASASADR